ncbi:MAG: ATP-binding cassette domain-containing protein, partial [Bdellovibrionaceae bacterium]|nr:ATP-binding cassette domain-containing protein [Pseudobdellovibrionaceae bacterium]
MIEIKDIKKSYKMGDSTLEVLKGVSLAIDDGDFVAIMGPSGSGKSTLMNILGLLDIPTTGSYQFNHKEISKLSENELAVFRRDEIGFIFQQFNLLPRMSALENVALPLLYSKNEKGDGGAIQLLNQVGLGSRTHHKPNELS